MKAKKLKALTQKTIEKNTSPVRRIWGSSALTSELKPRIGSIAILDRLLADYAVLSTQALSLHWNLRGPEFISCHAFFEKRYHKLNQRMDEIAERLRAIGVSAPAGFSEWLELSNIEELPLSLFEKKVRLNGAPESLSEHPVFVYLERERQVRDSILHTAIPRAQEVNDAVTEEILVSCLKEQDKTIWMLASLFHTIDDEESSVKAPQKGAA
jgi:starvation-inducible DNA-binding protein